MISAIHGNVPNVATLDIQQCPVDKGKIVQSMAIGVVEFSREGYKIRKVFA